MQINIAGWSCEGLRCPDVDIDLREGNQNPFHVAFVQMPNGTGKTTTLELLKATLSGDGANWDDNRVRGLRRRNATNATGNFKVKLLVDEKPATFELDFDFENGRAVCLTTKPGSGGITKGWAPPPELRRFLDISFLNLFVFNGELANRLFEPDEDKAENAIDALCQLYLLSDIEGTIEKRWEDAASRAGPKTGGALEALRTKTKALLARKVKLERTRKKAVVDMAHHKKESDDLEAKIKAKTANMTQDQNDLADAKTTVAIADARVKTAVSTLHQKMRLPLSMHPAIGAALARWKDHLEDLKLPEATSAQFFTDLGKKNECICGNPMTEVMKAEIESRARQVLSSAENGQLNIIKGTIEKYQPAEGELSYHADMKEKLLELSDARRIQLESQQTVRSLWRKIVDAGGDQVKEWERLQEDHDAKYAECDAMVTEIDDPGLNTNPNAPIFSLAKIKRDIETAKDKITDASNTVDLRTKTELIESIIKRAEQLARRTIKAELLEACNNRLSDILSDDPIELEAIDGHLKLAGQERGSEAQTLSVGYTFLMTLLERGNNRFPLLVDSPVGKMDGTVRRRVGRLIPQLCSQFVSFVINTERADFVNSVNALARNTVHLTFFRKTDGTQRLMEGLPEGRYVETETGVLIDDKSYFDSFDMEEEV